VVDRQLNYGRDVVRRFVDGIRVETAVDLGPGLGYDSATMRSVHPSARIIGIEVHPPYVEHLRSIGVDTVECDIEHDPLPFDVESVDLIVANQVLEHVKEVFWILHECSRVLRVGGSLVIGVPNIAAAHNRLLLLVGRQPTQLRNWSAHVRGFTKGDVLELLDKPFVGGYRLVQSGGANFYPLPAFLARPAARLWPGGAWGFFGRYEKVRPYDDGYLRWPVGQILETNFYLGPGAAS
jgi:SAM-dependent methyltransferase